MSNIIKASYVLDEVPKSCAECPFYREGRYQCHNERGKYGICEIGYMTHYDTRDFYPNRGRFRGCMIKTQHGLDLDISVIFVDDEDE